MGKPITRLNPKIESSVQKISLDKAIRLLLSIALVLPEQEIIKRGPMPYDYRKVLVICVLKVLLRKTYADYEIEMRNDKRICNPFGYTILPGKSTVQRYMNLLSMDLLREFNRLLIQKWINRKLDVLIDASGIRIIGRSIWYSIRIKKRISRRECDKVHLAVCKDTLLVLNWFITESKKNDCPFFTRLLEPIKFLGTVLADAGYLSRKNYQYAADRNGCAFIDFKKNSTARTKSAPAWKWAFHLYKAVPMLFKGIYNQRSKVETVFSVLKKRYGDKLYNKGAYRRRREFALRLIAYNTRLIIYLNYAAKHNLSCWVRAKQ